MPPDTHYYFDDQFRFCIDNFNWAKPFSNYFPGIAGKWGIPMWVYYVSQGQAICSMGIEDKDHAIMEFLSFNKACMAVRSSGFRTFLRIGGEGFYEPYRKTTDTHIQQRMLVSSHELALEETNRVLGLAFRVIYHPLVNQPVAGLVRTLEIQNLRQVPLEFELVDGLPRLLPYGVTFEHTNVIARHIEGMMAVDSIHGIPLYRLKQTPDDIDRIGAIQGGNFYFSFSSSGELFTDHWLIDPYPVFNDLMNYDHPWTFEQFGLERVFQTKQIHENRTPSAMTGLSLRLGANETISLHSMVGFTPEEERFPSWVSEITQAGKLQRNRKENRALIETIQQTALTVSNEPLFDQYCQQTFLENVMRGGYPLNFQSKENDALFYTYIRQNGDLERDYHWFILEATYLSQGNSHYRNILQNRRMDTWFFPFVKDENILTLVNLIQLDGYNPLEVNSVTYSACDRQKAHELLKTLVSDASDFERLRSIIDRPFTPGRFIMALEGCQSRRGTTYEEALADLLSYCSKNEVGGRHAGYWIDHWIYLLDIIEIVFSMYPDQISDILLGRHDYSFYDNPDVVLKREEKIASTPNGLRQYGAVKLDAEKAAMIQSREEQATRVRTRYGQGEIYFTNLLVKFLCILANRLASLDVNGIGSEMEASKPGWCDSLNGLPGLFGSSVCEALEIVRACRLLLDALSRCELNDQDGIAMYIELSDFINGLAAAMSRLPQSATLASRRLFWSESHDLLEAYRERVRFGVSGDERQVSIQEITGFLHNALSMLETNFSEASKQDWFSSQDVPHTYYINWLESDKNTGETDKARVAIGSQPYTITRQPLSLFLEGPVHYIRVYPDQAASVYQAVRNSPLFDAKLRMYRNCAPLDEELLEIGRIKAYANGWLENQSIYTHMEYKWLLELFRAGRYAECFTEFKSVLVPFMDPKVYGRSTLENCSFIVSSAFPDETMHGQAFQPHLSGMTCEFLNLWALMVAGKEPISRTADGVMEFKLDPVLPHWLFTEEEKRVRLWDGQNGWQEVNIPRNSFAFKLFGTILVIYSNPHRQDTFGPAAVKPARYQVYFTDGQQAAYDGGTLDEPLVAAIRENKIARMDVSLI